jgi:hypothetical protein
MDNAKVTQKKTVVSHRNIARALCADIWFCPNCAETIHTFDDEFIQIGDKIGCGFCNKEYIVEE